MPRFTIRLDDMTATCFDAFAERFGGRSQAMRALVEQALTASRATQNPMPADAGKQRLEVRLDHEDMMRLNDAAKIRRCKPTWWASRLIRAQLRGETIEPPLDLEVMLAGLLPKAGKAPQTAQGELEAAGQMRLLD